MTYLKWLHDEQSLNIVKISNGCVDVGFINKKLCTLAIGEISIIQRLSFPG